MDVARFNELKRNHDIFRHGYSDYTDPEKRRILLANEIKRLKSSGKEVRCVDDLIAAKNPEFIWLQLRYEHHTSTVPGCISKYFDNSVTPDDYEMNGCAEMEIYSFPKTHFPLFTDIIKQFRTEYFLNAPPLVDRNDYLLKEMQYPLWKFNQDHEIVLDIEDLYCNSFVKFNAFDRLFGQFDQGENRKYDIYDFVPHRTGYKNSTQIRLRCLFESGNCFKALYETDKGWILTDSHSG